MKNFLFLVIAFFSFLLVDAQEQIPQLQEKIYQMEEVDVKPEYPGGIMEFNKFISKNIKAPEKEGLNGKVVVAFIIEIDGNISNITVVQDIGYGSGEEAVRVVKESKKWIPAQKEGKPVRVVFRFPITISSVRR
jgi:TonB family protein